jgi:ribonuclease P protein component
MSSTERLFAFPKLYHLRRPTDFRRVYDFRRSASDHFLIVYACPNKLPYLRLGLSVSRKVGKATQRNRLRRLFREAFRLMRPHLPTGLDLVLIPRVAEAPRLLVLQGSLSRLVKQLAQRLHGEGRLP